MKKSPFETIKTSEKELEQVKKKIEALKRIIEITREAKLQDDYLPQLSLRDVEEGLRFAEEEKRGLEN